MEYQLREYDMNPGELEAFVQEWRAKIVPLRTKFGFMVVGAWFSHEENKFIWILGWDGPGGSFRKADERYSRSPGRRAVDPNPARHIAYIRETILSSALERPGAASNKRNISGQGKSQIRETLKKRPR